MIFREAIRIMNIDLNQCPDPIDPAHMDESLTDVVVYYLSTRQIFWLCNRMGLQSEVLAYANEIFKLIPLTADRAQKHNQLDIDLAMLMNQAVAVRQKAVAS